MKEYVIALDQGTTSSRSILFDKTGKIICESQREYQQIYPKPGWVEHNPHDIYFTQLNTLQSVLLNSEIMPQQISAIGITNQRETTIVWDKHTGQPIYNAIVWQCRRTSDFCKQLIAEGHQEMIRQKTGLLIDAYFSATKIRWILDHVEGAREKALQGDLLFGTVDSWIIWNLTGGEVHVTDHTNASRTMLYNIFEDHWDEELLDLFQIPASMLPKVVCSSEIVGYTNPTIVGARIPIAGIAGDQQAALFGQGCFAAGEAKNTYGTGCFLLMNTGEKAILSQNNLLTTMACSIDSKPRYALEGSIFVGGAAVQWLRDELEIINSAEETEEIARSLPDNGGVYMVPAFSGLGAPYWDMYSRGTIIGLTRGTGRKYIVRATLEAIAYQVKDILHTMEKDAEMTFRSLKVDGGASQNNFLMQFQADILNATIIRPIITETTALGAAYLAGLATGVWQDLTEIQSSWQVERCFEPQMTAETRKNLYQQWQKAVQRSLAWEK